MSAPNAKASSSIVRGLSIAASSAIAAVVGYTAITTKFGVLASDNSSAVGSTFIATQGHLRVVGARTIKASAGTVVSSALAPAKGSAKVASAGRASAGTAASSALTASQGKATAVVATGSALAATVASSVSTTSQESATAVRSTGIALARTVTSSAFATAVHGSDAVALAASTLTTDGVAIISAFATAHDSIATATTGNILASAVAAATSHVAAAKGNTVAAAKENDTVATGNPLASDGTLAGSALAAAPGTPAYIAASKAQPTAGYASTSAFLQSAAAKGMSASKEVILLMPEKVALGAGVSVAGAIVDLQAAGFKVGGIEAGSAAAAVQSVIGDVAKGSIFSLLQSKGTIGAEVAVIL